LYNTDVSLIENNTVKYARQYGLYLNNSNGNTIEGNTFVLDGQDVSSITSSRNIFRGNQFMRTPYPAIEINAQSFDNLITRNTFDSTQGVSIISGTATVVQNNFLESFAGLNIWIYGTTSPIAVAEDLPMGGNYYDTYSNPAHTCIDADNNGVCDTARDMAPLYGGTETVDSYPWVSQDGWLSYVGTTTPQNSNILFLPGLEASRLYQNARPDQGGGEHRLWEPSGDNDVRSLFLDQNGKQFSLSGDDPIYTRDVMDSAYVSGVGPDIYGSFLSELDAMKTKKEIVDNT
jgi:parallel beta-helix repeat protein